MRIIITTAHRKVILQVIMKLIMQKRDTNYSQYLTKTAAIVNENCKVFFNNAAIPFPKLFFFLDNKRIQDLS